MKRMRDILRRFAADDKGLTAAELMVTTLLMGFIMGAIWLAFGATGAVSDTTQARAIAADESRVAFDRITREIRQAQENTEGTGAITIIEPRRIQFYFDVDQDGRPSLITYYVSNGAIYRTEAKPTNQYAPFTFGSAGTPQLIVKTVKPDWTGDIFQYYNNANPPVRVTAAPINGISAVRIEIINQGQSGQRKAYVDSTTWVRIRSVQNNLN